MKTRENKPDIILLSCSKYKNGNISNGHESSSWEDIKTNFGSNLLFIYYGNPNQKRLFRYNKNKKILSIRTSDEYDNIPTKSWLAYYFWFYRIDNKSSHLITFGDDCKLKDKQKYINTNFSNIDYGGCRIHGPKWINNYHHGKVNDLSPQYNKISPRPNTKTKWVHEGDGVIFSRRAIFLLLKKHNLDGKITKLNISNFTKYVNKTCWYNDVLLSHEFNTLKIKIKKVLYYGIEGDH